MSSHLFEGKFGIERETLRLDSFGRLAQTPHPFGEDPHITRDFCENQIELVTPVCNSIDEAVDALAELDALMVLYSAASTVLISPRLPNTLPVNIIIVANTNPQLDSFLFASFLLLNFLNILYFVLSYLSTKDVHF